ncbi:NDUFAB1 [Lepeophtheirus salmonis]|uniref:Acyl carrier protein n=1 Tax=Lepeophtheirus salmonis TaxID=72036 RepID=A0A7R8CB76_LEPSM|nr:NDUFAB1 [Lepeophtheirus salmonis]CAF2753833.1 NDUFAB1 [Lepeophtheirus salmonis]
MGKNALSLYSAYLRKHMMRLIIKTNNQSICSLLPLFLRSSTNKNRKILRKVKREKHVRRREILDSNEPHFLWIQMLGCFMQPRIRNLEQLLSPKNLIQPFQFQAQILRKYSATVEMSIKKIEERILLVLNLYDKVDNSKLTLDSHFINDLGLDSLDHVEVIMAVEDEFGFEIPDDHADKLLTPRKLIVIKPWTFRTPISAFSQAFNIYGDRLRSIKECEIKYYLELCAKLSLEIRKTD